MEASATSSPSRPSWNPLKCSGAATRPNALLAVKLLAFSVIVELVASAGPWWVVAPAAIASAALLLNRRPRLAAAALGATVLLAAATSQAWTGGEPWFLGLFLIAFGVARRGAEPTVGRAALVLYYGAAAASRLAAPDWFAGRALGAWAAAPEAVLAIGFALPRRRTSVVWVGVLYHVGAAVLGGVEQPTALAFPLAAYLAAASWPEGSMLVIYDGDCGFCRLCRRAFERLDLDGVYRWAASQSGVGETLGIPRGELEQSVHVVSGERVAAGFRAVQTMLLLNPLTYFAAAAAWTLPFLGATARGVLAGAAIAFFFPLFNPVGEAAYAWVARNRRFFPGEDACGLPSREP